MIRQSNKNNNMEFKNNVFIMQHNLLSMKLYIFGAFCFATISQLFRNLSLKSNFFKHVDLADFDEINSKQVLKKATS